MTEKEIVKEYTDSIEVSVNGKGEPSYKVKAYGDCKTEAGMEKLESVVREMEQIAATIAKQLRADRKNE